MIGYNNDEIYINENPIIVDVIETTPNSTKKEVIEIVKEEYNPVSITEDIKAEIKNYEDLINLPKINGQVIRGDKRLIDYGYDTISIAELNDLLK